MTSDDMELVREYAATNSERAFAALVSRHVNLVHSVAMRQVGDAHHRLTEEQNAHLFQVVRAEPYELVCGIHGLDLAFWGPQEHIDNHLWQIAQSNQHILDQAANILTLEQLGVLSNVLSNGISTRIAEAAAFIRKP